MENGPPYRGQRPIGRPFRYYFDVNDLAALEAEFKPYFATLPADHIHGPVDQAHGQRELMILAPDGGVVLCFLFLEQMLVRDGDGDLRFDLQELVFHIEDQLLQHFFGIFGAVDEVVEIGAKKGGNAFEEGHGVCAPLSELLLTGWVRRAPTLSERKSEGRATSVWCRRRCPRCVEPFP